LLIFVHTPEDQLIVGTDIFGDMSLLINASKLITEARLKTLNLEMSYNSFGEMTASNLKRNALSISEMAMTRDALGRISRRTERLDGKIRDLSFAYDKSGRLVSVKKSQGRVLREYIFDDNGNRIEKIENG
jgi:YD repeat-containing protein